jgi:hypothetical protein
MRIKLKCKETEIRIKLKCKGTEMGVQLDNISRPGRGQGEAELRQI